MPFTRNMIISLLFLMSSPLAAEQLNIPGHYAQDSQLVMPRRGIKMDQVLAQFGEPDRRVPAVGEPPITEWDYADFQVYFEYDTVLHSIDLSTIIMPNQAK